MGSIPTQVVEHHKHVCRERNFSTTGQHKQLLGFVHNKLQGFMWSNNSYEENSSTIKVTHRREQNLYDYFH